MHVIGLVFIIVLMHYFQQIKMWQADYKAMKTKEYQDKMASRKRKAGGDKKDGDDEKEEVKEEMPKGALIKLLNIPEGFTREIIKEKWFGVLDKEKFSVGCHNLLFGLALALYDPC